MDGLLFVKGHGILLSIYCVRKGGGYGFLFIIKLIVIKYMVCEISDLFGG